MDNLRLSLLFNRSLSGKLSPDEREELSMLLADPENEEQLKRLIESGWDSYVPGKRVISPERQGQILESILSAETGHTHSGSNRWYGKWSIRLFAAASMLLAVFGVYTISRQSSDGSQQIAYKPEIKPGGNRATLTLSDGRTVILDEAENGIVARDLSSSIHKEGNGHLVYEAEKNLSKAQLALAKQSFNIISTPNGGVYEITLPDGTQVSLNSASSLKYPTVFAGDKRVVELTGEGYFKVAKALSKKNRSERLPFIVKTAKQSIEVLGTHFNVNAYRSNDYIKTTLVEGKVRIVPETDQSLKHPAASILLEPGEEAFNDLLNNRIKVTEANVIQATAWRKGYFIFDNDNIKDIMEQIARWYDVDVSYHGDMSDKKFGGIFQRSKSIYQFMNTLEQTGTIHFKIEERRILVMAK